MLLDTPLCDFGWKAPDFELSDPQGNSHSLSNLKGENGTLIAFICNHCPYVITIAERFVADAKELQDNGIAIIAINSNDYRSYPSDSPERMIGFAEKYGFTFPYLIDETQEVARTYDAVCTPDFFGLNAQGELQYRGRIDDARMGDASKRNRELVNAMLQIAETGKGPKEQTASAGCSIKWR